MAQVEKKDQDSRSDIQYPLNSTGSHYIKATFLNQTWLRLNENNPGTTVLEDPANNTFDIGLRRTRVQLYGQLTDRVFFYTQFGMNNFNKMSGYPDGNRKVQPFFHDAVGEYEAYRKGDSFVRFGGGLTVVNGLSRFTQASVGTIMTMDVPVFAQATVEQTDQFDRKLSVYSRGQIGPLNYRLAVTDPFPIESNGKVAPGITSHSVYAQKNHKKQFQGLLIYNFLDTESLTTPGYMTGTYLGKRRVLNLEAGFITQKNATWRTVASDTVYNNLTLLSVAAFADMPFNRATGTAISAYLGYFYTDYGKGYLRYNGIMNPASGTQRPIAGVSGTQGNAFPMFGTGQVVYAQVGYKLKDDLLGEQGTLMPYASLQYADYERIHGGMDVFNVGINWLVKGHGSKFSLNYESRPTYVNDRDPNYLKRNGRKGSWVLQYQISI
ncbi:hypothetical protein CLV98_102463 [Dyadobacter jejuensis]|uniref:Short chain amide porin n=2 Tax=Dyadobacter jejuensis TaxID=1082580 RepID=A0A316AQQ7_9BACT|nr:hypothetical protein CLV98_102463 [Dyadobacter jejuensis]